MPSKSKIKGSTYERDIARYLTETYGQTFVRVPTSGAYVGGSNAHRASTLDRHQLAAHKGDIQPPSGWQINIEVKNYASIPWHQMINQECKQLDTWIDQLEQVSAPADIDIIFFKISRQGQFVCVRHHPCFDLTQSLQYNEYFVYNLDQFFAKNKETLKRLCTN